MARPRKYETNAQRQKAFPDRLVRDYVQVERRSFDRLLTTVERLAEAVNLAARWGDPLAQRCRAASTDTVLERLITAFEEQGAVLRAQAPIPAAAPAPTPKLRRRKGDTMNSPT